MLHRLITRGLQSSNNFVARPNQFPQLQIRVFANQFVGVVTCGRETIASNREGLGIIGAARCKQPITMSTRGKSSKSSVGNIKVYSFTKNLHFYSSSRQNWDKDSKTLRLSLQLDKPLVIIFAWMLASEKHLKKFSEFYIEQGFEVMVAHLSPWQLVWPVHGSQAIANDVLSFLRNNDLEHGTVIHGFSVGGYLWGECLVKIHQDEANKTILDKIKGQVWDSVADITEIPVGVPHAVLPKNPTLQSALRGYMTYHLKIFHEEATQYYDYSSKIFFNEPARCPALILVSKTDRIGTESANQRLRATWDSLGMKTTMKCWDRSPHVGHFHKYRDEYIDLLQAHLSSLQISCALTWRAKL